MKTITLSLFIVLFTFQISLSQSNAFGESNTLMAKAVENEDTAAMVAIIKKEITVNSNLQDKNYCLILSTLFSIRQSIPYLIEIGAEIDYIERKNGATALLIATSNGSIDIVKYLLSKGANINAKNILSENALIKASSKGNLEMVKLLVESGIDVDAVMDGGYSALDLAKGKEVKNYLEEIDKKDSNTGITKEIPLKVTDGILYTVDGKWGDGMLLHYSKSKYGVSYRANLKIAPGEHTLEYLFKDDQQIHEVTFTAKPNNEYFVYNENHKPVVKENKTILNDALIRNTSAKSSDDGYQIIPGITDTSQIAILLYESTSDSWNTGPEFIMLKVDKYWGDGSTGYFSGQYNDIRKDEFKVKMPIGEHTLSAQLKFGSHHQLAIKELSCNFEAGKTYTIEFDTHGFDLKKRINDLQIKLILNSAKIVEINQ